jgi:hypothetical protein
VNRNDTGAGSFRQAIIDANAAPDADSIEFAVAGKRLLIHIGPTCRSCRSITCRR